MIMQCYILHLSSLDSLPYRQTAFQCHSLGNPWERCLGHLRVPMQQAVPLLKGHERGGETQSVAFPSQLFTGFWKREFLLLLLMLFLFSKTIRFWCCQSGIPSLALEKLISIILCILHWKPCKMPRNSPVIFFFLSLIAFMLSARTKGVSVNYLCICWNH